VNELRDLGRDGRIADFVDQPPPGFPYRFATGVSLRIDDYWLSWYSFTRHSFPLQGVGEPQRAMRVHHGERYDFSRTPDDWGEYCKGKGYADPVHPVAVIVILGRELLEGIPDSWPKFVDNHPVVYEYRPEAVLQALRPGDTVAGATTGTLGGYLWRPSDGKHVAISCAHVFGSAPGAKVHAGSAYIGSVIESHFPPPTSGSARCNSRIGGAVAHRSVDVAVSDLAGGPSIRVPVPGSGKVTRRTAIAHIGQGDPVMLVGGKSGRLRGKVKECNIWKEFTFQGVQYCFGDLLVLEDVTFHYIASSFTKDGDSGAWVVSTGAGHVSWDAMHIAGDGANSYCSYSENIMAAIDPGLVIPP
jgi:hypothetical protein